MEDVMDEVIVQIAGHEFKLDADGLEFLAHCMRMSADQRQAMLKFVQNIVDKEQRKKLLHVIDGGRQDQSPDSNE